MEGGFDIPASPKEGEHNYRNAPHMIEQASMKLLLGQMDKESQNNPRAWC